MSEINSQINHSDIQINKDLLTEIKIFKEILKVSKESRYYRRVGHPEMALGGFGERKQHRFPYR